VGNDTKAVGFARNVHRLPHAQHRCVHCRNHRHGFRIHGPPTIDDIIPFLRDKDPIESWPFWLSECEPSSSWTDVEEKSPWLASSLSDMAGGGAPSTFLGGPVLCGRLRLTTSNTMNGPQQGGYGVWNGSGEEMTPCFKMRTRGIPWSDESLQAQRGIVDGWLILTSSFPCYAPILLKSRSTSSSTTGQLPSGIEE